MNLNVDEIRSHIGSKYRDMTIFIYNSIDSTNTQAKLYAENTPGDVAVFISEEQTAGRGRLGKSFISNSKKGLYLSLLINNEYKASEAVNLTTYMAVIASSLIEELSGLEVKIKWVNDLYVNDKKLSGILTEGKINPNGTLDYAIIGIGINLYSQEYPEEIKSIATDIETECGKSVNINDIAGKLINDFLNNIDLLGSKKIVKAYKARSFLTGKRVTVIKPTEQYNATVLGISDDCALKVQKEDGLVELLTTGEVSLKTIK
jgi:BirA family biotin operon repressor/biotin-[acetyl-CoA-carboxylase] ligase